MNRIIITFLILSISVLAVAKSRFDELDKPPEGAHQGQMFLGAILSVGGSLGPVMDNEEAFINGSIYDVISGEVYKKIWLSHLNFSTGISFEYMPIDHLGVKAKIRGDFVLQRTMFGAEYENWSVSLYRSFSIVVGPVGHLTNRKRWDVTFTPVLGYSFGGFTPAPVANTIISSDVTGSGKEQQVHAFTFGAEVNLSIYFSGGFYLSLGFDWNMFIFSLDSPVNLSNSNSGSAVGYSSDTDLNFHNLSFIIGVGYAFSN